jgi:CelD/BcsL family acetyltransferase involved in cellulose biosynthesis
VRSAGLTIARVDDLDSVRPEWSELAERSGNVFMTWEWTVSWLRHIAPTRKLAVAMLRKSDGTPFAVLPMFLAVPGPVPVLRLIGAGPSDELGPICAPRDRLAATQLLREYALELLQPGGVLLAEQLVVTGGLAPVLRGVALRHGSTPVIPMEGETFESFLTTRSRNFRSQLGRAQRRLEREHRLVFRLTTDPGALEGDLASLMRLHASRWSSGHSTSFAGARGAFHHDFARRALANGWLRLWTMELDGEPAASWYGLRFGGVEHYYQSGRDPRYESLKVGFVLLAHTLRCAFDDGLREYRLGRGAEEYKRRFTDVDPGLTTVALGVGLRGRLAVSALKHGLDVRDRARSARGRLGSARPSARVG